MGESIIREEPVVTEEDCIGCEACVVECPEHVLAMDSHEHAIVVDAEDCIDCHICERTCPTYAIHLMAA